jgi:hypothetical protein
MVAQPVDRNAQYAATIASHAAGQKSQYWANAEKECGGS